MSHKQGGKGHLRNGGPSFFLIRGRGGEVPFSYEAAYLMVWHGRRSRSWQMFLPILLRLSPQPNFPECIEKWERGYNLKPEGN